MREGLTIIKENKTRGKPVKNMMSINEKSDDNDSDIFLCLGMLRVMVMILVIMKVITVIPTIQ